ncbi:MAG: DEAD/DEAH box helicase [Lachnospiraceae bacterium]|nr:DEAD/DEAH box helicase [Lachnospiraceae bacterium]
MRQLSRTIIKNLAAGEMIYSRGIQHFRNGDIKNISVVKSTGQIRVSVRDVFEYTVMLNDNSNGEITYSCNCAQSLKERDKGACKHVVAGLFALLKAQEKEKMSKQPTPEDRRACSVLDYFQAQEDLNYPKEVFHIEPIITVPEMLGSGEAKAYLSIKAGREKLYKVQTLKKFLMDYLKQIDITLGKEFTFICQESEFDKSSQNILDFILEVFQIAGMDEEIDTKKLFQKANLVLTQPLLLKFLRLIGKNTLTLVLYGKVYENIRVFKSNPNIKYDLDIVDDTILLDYRDKEAILPLTRNGDLIYYNGGIFIPSPQFKRNYAPFFNALGRDKPALLFRGENKKRFLEELLPKIGDSMDIDIPEELQDRYLDLELKSKIFFDKYNNGIKAEIHFVYGDFEFSSFSNPDSDYYIILRKKEEEDALREMLENYGFEARNSFYLLKSESAIYEFLLSEKADLMAKAELYYSEDFKKLKIKSGGNFNIGLRVSSKMDLLEMSFDFENMSSEELKSLFRSLKVRKKYYRMQDGSFINLLDGDMERLSDILDNLGVTSKNIEETGIVLNKSNAFYLDDALEKSGFVVKKNKDFVELIKKIKNASDQEYEFPENINAELRGYQKTGYQWMRTLAANSLGGILADDMGLGKTLQAICYISGAKNAATEEESKHFLIICPSSIIYNWLDEINNFAPFLKCAVVVGAPQDRKDMIESYEDYDILITSYPLIRRDVQHYKKIRFNSIFIDEAQFIKNAASLNAQSVKQLVADHRFALTGTPIENSLSELWSIFDFIMPNFLMTHTRFTVRYEKPVLNGDKQAMSDLSVRIRPFIMRRMKKDVLRDLPDKLEEKMLTDLTEEQRKVYLSYMNDIRGDLFGEIKENGIEKSKMKILAALTRLRQICCHPSTFLSNYTGGSGKMDLLLQQLDNAIANGHRTIIFSQFTGMLELIKAELDAKNIGYFYLDGGTPPKERLKMAKDFNEGENSVFLISLKAGGTGLNLTGADTVIHYDPWWNPAVEDQATDRAYRIGQTSNVYVLKLLTRGTIEEKIYKLQQKKKELSDFVIQPNGVFLNSLSEEELEDIFSYN